MVEQLTGDRTAEHEQDDSEHHVADATAGHIQHREQHSREQQRRPEVLLPPEQNQRRADHQQDRREIRQRRQIDRTDAPAGECQQLAVLLEIGGQEQDQQQLYALGRLHADWPNGEPQSGAAAVRVLAKQQREYLQGERKDSPGVAITAQPLDGRQQSDQDHRAEPNQDPDALAGP